VEEWREMPGDVNDGMPGTGIRSGNCIRRKRAYISGQILNHRAELVRFPLEIR
jgi:hypothetical protein